MEITEVLLQYDTYGEASGDVAAVVVAAGSSSRMGGTSKQLMNIGGIPVLARTLLAFERAKCIKNIVIVARECDILSFQMLVDKYMITKVSDIVPGGSCREESVKNGIERLKSDTECVLIHDGVRPFITEEIIESVAGAVKKHGAAACAVPVKDTLKVVSDGVITETLDRSKIYSVQTPQGFNLAAFREAITAAEDLSVFTDDCSIMESAGKKVYIVEGSYNNIKITTREDIVIAEGIISGGELC
ncbi:MAG: 2-C-methyl-D-erythritol 4-phosphate cytidylyltransferase [Clostridia bacterium]|nr:2-C-methyl-D-erythritol 4-phosphate cytidylyltransferase [Clostridia bacterium]